MGSGHTADPDLPRLDQLSYVSLNRVAEGMRWYRGISESKLIFSGYGNQSTISQARANAETALSLGAKNQDIALIPEPGNTGAEALAYLEKFGQKNTLVLVTSAYHMPRAMHIFEKQGLDPVPAPTDFQVMKDPVEGFDTQFFSPANFNKVQLALHEYLGLLYVRWFG